MYGFVNQLYFTMTVSFKLNQMEKVMYQSLHNLGKTNDQGLKRFYEQTNMTEIFYYNLR